MIESIELQMISKILVTDSEEEIDVLCSFDESYYSIFREQIKFILDHRIKYGNVPDIFTFQAQFPDVTLVQVRESIQFLKESIQENKQYIILLETFNKIKELGSADVKDAWRYIGLQYERVLSLDSAAPMNIIHQARERADEVIRFSKQARIPTGFDEIDKLMYGGFSTVEELVIVVARTNTGKAQPLWSKVLTPNGWKTMGELKVGDVVVGKHNDNGKVIKIFPQGTKKYFRVHFDDDTYTECCDDHLWEVLSSVRRERSNSNYGKFEVLTLKDIRNNLDNRYTVDVSSAIEFQSEFNIDDNLDGYLLGVLLGDGGFRDGGVTLSNENKEIWDKIETLLPQYGCERGGKSNDRIVKTNKVNGVKKLLVNYGLYGLKSTHKFIPSVYFTAPVCVRKSLLAGLLDTDGYMSKHSKQVFEFDTASKQLAYDFVELSRSLGVKCKMYHPEPSYYTNDKGQKLKVSDNYHITGRCEFNPFTLPRKADRFIVRQNVLNRSYPKRLCKRIVDVEYVGETECQCILLDNESHTYITDDYIVTHNSWVMTKFMESAQANKFPCLYYSPEMQASFLGTRFDTWRKHFQNSQLYRGNYNEEYQNYIKELENEATPAFILEDKDVAEGSVNVPVLESLVKRYRIKLLIIDGLSYMEDNRSRYSDRDYEKYKNLSTDLFKLSKRYGCAVVIAMQANRESKDSKDDKGEIFPTAMNIEGSDHPARIATQVFSIRQIFERHVLDIRLEKSRMANNQKPILSYSWDINTGNIQNIQGEDSGSTSVNVPTQSNIVTSPKIVKHVHDDSALLDDDDFDDVEF